MLLGARWDLRSNLGSTIQCYGQVLRIFVHTCSDWESTICPDHLVYPINCWKILPCVELNQFPCVFSFKGSQPFISGDTKNISSPCSDRSLECCGQKQYLWFISSKLNSFSFFKCSSQDLVSYHFLGWLTSLWTCHSLSGVICPT